MSKEEEFLVSLEMGRGKKAAHCTGNFTSFGLCGVVEQGPWESEEPGHDKILSDPEAVRGSLGKWAFR